MVGVFLQRMKCGVHDRDINEVCGDDGERLIGVRYERLSWLASLTGYTHVSVYV